MSYGKKSNSFVCVLGGITAYNMINGMFFLSNKRNSSIVWIFKFIHDFDVVQGFYSIGHIIQNELSAEEIQLLTDNIRVAVRGLTPLDIPAMIFALQTNSMIADLMMQTVRQFLLETNRYADWKEQPTPTAQQISWKPHTHHFKG